MGGSVMDNIAEAKILRFIPLSAIYYFTYYSTDFGFDSIYCSILLVLYM